MTDSVIDDAPYSGFHRKLTVVSAGGPFMDGYILTNVGIVSVGLNQSLNLTPAQFGMVGAATLIGMFFSAGIVGRIADMIGRKQFYVIDMVVMVVASILCFFVEEVWWLIALRFILGLAIGADFPIATSMLTEWLPKMNRGKAVGMLMLAWFLGANAAYIVGYFAVEYMSPDMAWRVVLASAGVLGIPLLIARLTSPESPRFLLSQGERERARHNINEALNIQVTETQLDQLTREERGEVEADKANRARVSDILRPPYGKRLLFCILFYTCQIVPLYAIYIYGPTILELFNLDDGSALGSLVISIIFTIGVMIAIGLVDRTGRRPLIVVCFAVMTIALSLLGFFPTSGVFIIILGFCLYALFSGGPSILEWIYPSELFPTSLRGMGVGIVTSASRIGAAIGIYLVPIALENVGLGPVMIAGAVVTVIGFLASVAWAPETMGQSLSETTTSLPVVEKDKVAR